MSTPQLEETTPISTEPVEKPKSRRGKVVLFGILAIVLLAVLGGLIGYASGIQQRKALEVSQTTKALNEQFELALVDQAMGRNETALQRLQYIIKINPGFPGVTDLLSKVMLSINLAKTPTAAPTPTIVPTPDLRGVEDLFNQAKQHMANKEWQATLDTLEAIHKAQLDYRALEVDGMYYVALRFRGIEKILNEGDLEGGMYNLSMVERYGPLDSEAESYRTWARIYATGASFWEVDWKQSSYYFGQVYQAFPNLHDGSNIPAVDRYRIALVGYGDDLMDAGDACEAQKQYELALSVGADAKVQPTAQHAADLCANPSGQPSATPSPTDLTPVPTETVTPPPATTEPPAATTEPPAVTTQPAPQDTTETPAP